MDADAALNEYIRRMIVNREDVYDWSLDTNSQHLEYCPDIVVTAGEGHDGSYGCETGCPYLNIEAEVTCPHMEGSATFDYSGFGDMDSVFFDLDRIRREAGDAV